ncbi:unnamed protein product [Vitrella brassicaformis CCMP3155]|uniref:RING-CH-type domain-containing protein n=1 Tax=Vitrella brassicaformis (strain CCMP3155) TaxID=1169540 RepID=A0A0G4FIM3_VITBC|nr:unnamed protein product [Vitrella brassicaformis CCMP3155]|eukprot:CEM13141.1 unnamed protein product [Vitrella brassicaformis CCMP3155]
MRTDQQEIVTELRLDSPLFQAQTSDAMNWLLQTEPGAVCRVCHSCDATVESGILIAPCGCKGTLRWVHTSCLGNWRKPAGGTARLKPTCDVCLKDYDAGPRGPFCLPVGLIPDALFALAYSLLACLPPLLAIMHSCDRSNILTRALRLYRMIPLVIVVGLTVSAFDWLAGRQHADGSSLRCGLRMAIGLIVTAAGALRMMGSDIWTFEAGGFRSCDNGARSFRRALGDCFVLLMVSLALLPYSLLKGDKVHQATREALLRFRQRHAIDSDGLFMGMVSLYMREGSYYLMIAVWSLTPLVICARLWSRNSLPFIPLYLIVALLGAISVWKRRAIDQLMEEGGLYSSSLAFCIVGVVLSVILRMASFAMRRSWWMFEALGEYDLLGFLVVGLPIATIIGCSISGPLESLRAAVVRLSDDHLRAGG